MSRSDIDEASVPLLETHRDPSVRGVKARTVAHTDTEVRPTSQGFAALGSNDSLGGGGETMRRTISQLIPAGRDVQATNPNAEPAKIDWGFDKQGFDLGSIATIKASDDLLHQQPPLSCSSAAGRCLGLTLAGLSVVGLPYVFCQCRVVPAGKLALCRGIGGNVRIVEPGCNCLEFACSKVKMFDVTTDQIDLGPMHIIRILPGQLGMASVNGRPYLMEPGWPSSAFVCARLPECHALPFTAMMRIKDGLLVHNICFLLLFYFSHFGFVLLVARCKLCHSN